MRILLAPSETKTAPAQGPNLRLDSLVVPALTRQRERVLEALVETSGREDALDILAVGPRLADAVAANMSLLEAPCAPAHRVYTGVAFDAAKLDEIPQHLDPLLIFSALFGLVGAADLIPTYRLSAGVTLPQLDVPIERFWRDAMKNVLADYFAGELILDCRSGAYQKFWVGCADSEVITTKILRLKDGRTQVVSHHAKHWRGLMTRAVLDALAAGKNVKTAEEIGEIVAQMPEVSDVRFEEAKTGAMMVVTAAETA